MVCELLQTTKKGQKIIGEIRLEGTTITGHPEPGAERLMQRVLKTSHPIDGKKITKEFDPRAWFQALPQFYSGTYLRARMIAPYAEMLKTAHI